LRFIIFALAIIQAASLASGAAAKTAAKRSPAKPAAVRTKTTTVARRAPVVTSRRVPATRYARTPVRYTPNRFTTARYGATRYSNRYGRNTRYRYVSYFRPVLAATSADFPELSAPLAGLTPRELQDSFYYRRPDGMIHYAIDIFRPIGEPLLAVVDGYVERIDPNPLGGKVVYLVDEEKRFRFYYAHLDQHAEGLYAGMPVKRGDVIGFVGDTGNAKGTQPHLHFQIASLAGAVVNPYPLLMDIVRREELVPSE
jgi:murein DD-endopeptidase MepM/ murein hydrolase activator NlpD